MTVHTATLHVETRGPGFVDVTDRVRAIVAGAGVKRGLCSVFIAHTSASLVIQENADPSVLSDLERFFASIAPEGPQYEHDAEGPDDMPAHIKGALLKTSETVPLEDGKLLLGTWQALYVVEHRRAPHTRKLIVTVMGDGSL